MASGATKPTAATALAAADRARSIRRLLIANRGEIVVRVAATARRLGIATVAVYSDADRGALHTAACDVAVALGGASPAESYLRGDAIIAAALRTGSDAIHPGYGFLAENAEFAEAVAAAGLIWVGPTPDQIRLLGDKIAAKRAAVDAGVETTTAVTVSAAGGYDRDALPNPPLLVKAAAGGGGRGMRIVESLDSLDDAIASAQRESEAAFGDGTVFIEPFIERGHHVEVQIFGDQLGNVVDLGERECSIQRRNQKVIEEAPSPTISAATRALLRSGAVALARAVGYVGAGTVEYLVAGPESDTPTISFLEVNTRLQVEHPVTEEITGVDLVEWQLAVAAGAPLPATQAEIDARLGRGLHAIEARIVAEDPAANWMPSTGTIVRFDLDDADVRVDPGVAATSIVTPDYDSLLAKVIAVGPSRDAAAGKLAAAMRTAAIVGVETNAALLADILSEADFRAGEITTAYLSEHPPTPIGDELIDRLVVAATVAAAARERGSDPVTGFAPSGWRNLATVGQRRVWRIAGSAGTIRPVEYSLHHSGEGRDREHSSQSRSVRSPSVRSHCVCSIGGLPEIGADGSLGPDDRRQVVADTALVWLDPTTAAVRVEIDGISMSTMVYFDQRPSSAGSSQQWWVTASSPEATIVFESVPRFVDHDLASVGGGPVSPLPGTVIAVHVADGDTVAAGVVLMVVEAMKMEHQITTPTDARVEHVRFAVGDRVDAGDLLVELSPLSGSDEADTTT